MIQKIRESTLTKFIFFLSFLIAFTFAYLWSAGGIFFVMNGHDFLEASPFTIIDYWKDYQGVGNVQLWIVICAIMPSFFLLGPLVVILLPKKQSLFGESRWARTNEIKKADLFSGENGIVVGYKKTIGKKKLMVFGGNQHVALASPTRAGKGVSVVIPNLLTWQDSVVVLDVKRENWDITAGFRAAHGQECYHVNFAPRDRKTHRYNPLFYISNDLDFQISDIQRIGSMLFPKIEREAPIWQASARSLWLGLVLFIIETSRPVTLGEVLRIVTMGDDWINQEIIDLEDSEAQLSGECISALNDYLTTSEKTRTSIRKSFTSALELFYNPVIDACTSGNDFDLRDLRKKRMSIYLVISPNDIEWLSPLINLFFQQVIDLNTVEIFEGNPNLKYKCLLLMDEFRTIGKIEVIPKGIGYIAQYGLRMLTVMQSMAQLKIVYGADEKDNYIENNALVIAFTPKDHRVAKEFSDHLGTRTVNRKSKTRRGIISHVSSTDSDHARPLMLPQEIMEIPRSKALVFAEYCKPILAERIIWYEDTLFKQRGNGRDGVKWKSPVIPEIHVVSQFSSRSIASNNIVPPEPEVRISTRNITPDDIENFADIELSDFSYDFSNIEVPKKPLSDEDIESLANDFFKEIQ
jgi:type IV secretion system protein VirD4